MFSFRSKIFLSYIGVFLLLVTLVYPFASHTVRSLFGSVMQDRTTEIIEKIKSAPDEVQLIQYLKEQKPQIFFRVSVISDERKVLYDSHTKYILGTSFSTDYVVNHPEVEQAFREGVGHHEDYSQILGQKFIYIAKVFDFHGRPFVVRTAFPYQNLLEIIHELKFGFIELIILVLLIFCLMTWFIINYFTKPIQKIVNVVKSYQEDIQPTIPVIDLSGANPTDDFSKLATTLNSLSGKIQRQIDSITAERNEKEAILESLIEGVIAVDVNMVVTYANNSALTLLNIPYDNLVGQSLASLPYHTCYALLAGCQRQMKVLTDTLILKNGDQKVYLDLVAAPKKENAGAILVLQDKSIQNRMLEMRREFIANASHELKTPLTIIQGFAETLHDTPDLPADIVSEITRKIVRNSQRMSMLIKDLLVLSDTENLAAITRFEKINMLTMIENCTVLLKDAFPDAIIDLEAAPEMPVEIYGDTNLIDMAMTNLIENGLKYSLAPAHVRIALSSAPGGLKIAISDKGIGIPPADLEHIFERFYTVDKARSRKMGGSGLGLSIVENVIKKHGGKITVTSKVGEGTTFIIVLPYQNIPDPN
jgi:two-component system phosphate regulon sensor histidine kinase PhoR